MELLGHTDCFHEDVWPREVGGGVGFRGISCVGSASEGRGHRVF